ncbi:hypothetical protein JCM10908_006666 [Rhodotorula pacifica]|uniref:uncharacterized protein n=1 Tax=Rhodotorula pacifica TaxID=1495444 RepID=UPI003179110A
MDSSAPGEGRQGHQSCTSAIARVEKDVPLGVQSVTPLAFPRRKAESTAEFIDVLLNVLTYINMHQAFGQMVIGAGTVNVLLDFVKISSSRGHPQMIAANKAVVILDGFRYGYTNAYTAFIGAKGLQAFIGRVKSEVDTRYRLFIFGRQVFGLVTNIAATFVPNEPSLLRSLQEAKVPDALNDSLEYASPASKDVPQAVPGAIGAFCLNQAGLDHFLTRDLISKYFAVFTSPAYYELLRDRNSAVNLGAAIDEPARHHSALEAQPDVCGRRW